MISCMKRTKGTKRLRSEAYSIDWENRFPMHVVLVSFALIDGSGSERSILGKHGSVQTN